MNDLGTIQSQSTIQGVGNDVGHVGNQRPTEPSIEFRALLERLREQAASLQRATEKPLNAGELSGAVQEAGESLQGALSIAEGLMEAYRASQMPPAENVANVSTSS